MGLEPVARLHAEDGFRKDRSGRVAGADEENPVLALRHWPVSLHEKGGERRTEVRAPPATVEEQVVEGPAHLAQIDRVEERPAFPPLRHQSGLHEGGEISRKRRGLAVQRLRQLPRRNPVRIAAHQQPEQRQPLRVTESGESGGDCRFHILRILEISKEARPKLRISAPLPCEGPCRSWLMYGELRKTRAEPCDRRGQGSGDPGRAALMMCRLLGHLAAGGAVTPG